MDWKVKDMCFFEFELSMIVEMSDIEVTEISTGIITTSTGDSFNDRCFPVTLEIKCISSEYKFWANKLHVEGLGELNYPDIHRWLVSHWTRTCLKPDDTEWIKSRYNELRDFSGEILCKCKELRNFVTSLVR